MEIGRLPEGIQMLPEDMQTPELYLFRSRGSQEFLEISGLNLALHVENSHEALQLFVFSNVHKPLQDLGQTCVFIHLC